MRKLVFFALGFAASCGLGSYLMPDLLPLWPAWMLLVLAVGVIFLVGRKWPRAAGLGLCLLGMAAGILWFRLYRGLYLSMPMTLDGQTGTITLRAADYGVPGDYGMAVDGRLTLDAKPYQVRAYLKEEKAVAPGDEMTGEFLLRVTAPGGQKESAYYQGKGVFLLAYQRGRVDISAGAPSWQDVPARARQQIKSTIDGCFSADTRPFARALVLGDTSQLDYETDTALKISGIRHVAAVSGLHVSILFALISAAALGKPWVKAALGLPALVLFAALAGFSASVTRACVMAGLMLLAPLLDREYDSPTALAFAALVMLAVNPLVIASVSFQLSVCSVGGIYLFSGRIDRWLVRHLSVPKNVWGKTVRWMAGSVSVSIGSCVLTTPLSAWYFGTVSLISILTNLLTLWAISLIFYGILFTCLAWLALPVLGIFLGKLVGCLIQYVLLVARSLAGFPLAAVYTSSGYITAWLVFCYVLLFVFTLGRNRKPVIFVCCVCLGLSVSILASWTEGRGDSARLTVLDVGQGQCILLQSGGACYMVDCGGDRDSTAADTAAQFLLGHGIPRLDGLILTHYDRDHAGGAAELLTRIDVDTLVLPPTGSDDGPYPAETVLYALDRVCMEREGARLLIFPPEPAEKGNDLSLCVLFDTENCDILITGDRSTKGEKKLLACVDLPEVDVLIAGHHGAADATGEELLDAIQPKIVCISAGENNSYGHPAPETLRRLEAHGCRIYRTDLNGMITIRR